jgi:hypothetical protein
LLFSPFAVAEVPFKGERGVRGVCGVCGLAKPDLASECWSDATPGTLMERLFVFGILRRVRFRRSV